LRLEKIKPAVHPFAEFLVEETHNDPSCGLLLARLRIRQRRLVTSPAAP
jgi:hypothetical protein